MKSPLARLFAILLTSAALCGGPHAHAQACSTGGEVQICLDAAAASDGVALSWTLSGEVSAIEVYRESPASPKARIPIARLPASARRYTDTTIPTAASYRYWIGFTVGATAYASNRVSVMAGAPCAATPLTPYMYLDGVWTQTAGATIMSGDRVVIGLVPIEGGSWSWQGCGITSTEREQTLKPAESCAAMATFINRCGAASTQKFQVLVEPAPLSYPDYNPNPLAADPAGMSSAMELAARMRLGWNLGNTLESIPGGETGWGNPRVTEAFIAYVKASGFDTIRLPVSWNPFADRHSAAISPERMARIKEIVQYCINQGLFVIVNIHWDGGWLENNITTSAQAAVNAKQKAFWQQIATELRGFDEHLLFASANEPAVVSVAGTDSPEVAAEHMSVLLSYHQTFVDAVRATGGRNAYRVLVVQGPNTNIDLTNNLMRTLPSDPAPGRMMVEVHYYEPWNYVGMTVDETWGNQAFYWGEGFHSTSDPAHNAMWGEEAYMESKFDLVRDQFVQHGIPVLIGEFATPRRTGQLVGAALELHLAGRAYFHEYVVRSALAHGLIPIYWDSGFLGDFGSGIFDRPNLRVGDPQTLEALLAGKR